MGENMRRDFTGRDDLIAYLTEQFPEAASISGAVSDLRGGRKAAEARMAQIDPGRAYEATRNNLDGAVTRLSAYIRYGVVNLRELRLMALRQARSPHEVEKFINELAWRDYWQRIYAELGDGIWNDCEPYKTGYSARAYADELPLDIAAGETGVALIDDAAHELTMTGYLHNHQRMWVAAYVVHWRRVRWQAGARWFLSHLLDGDPASNNLSWQWVASTFSAKPYYFNLENVLKYTGERYRGDARAFGHEIFEGSYERIAARLFPHADFGESEQAYDKRSNKGRR